jgi:hypothetical protein
VRISLSHDERLKIGASATATVELARRTGVTLPLSAVSYDNQGAYAQIVVDNIVRERRLTTGILGSDEIEVVDGLKEGDQVVAKAGSFVHDGDRIRPVLASAQEATQ